MWRATRRCASAARNGVARPPSSNGARADAPSTPIQPKIGVSLVWPIDFSRARAAAEADGRTSLRKLKQAELQRLTEDPEYKANSDYAMRLSQELKLPLVSHMEEEERKHMDYELQVTPARLQLKARTENYTPNIYVDFDAYVKRRESFTVDSPLIRSVSSLGPTSLPRLSIVDATGGLARDAFLLASFGPRLTVLERHPIIYALLTDGVKRAKSDEAKRVLARMAFIHGDSLELLPRFEPKPDVVYLDPMFTWPKKSMPRALPKKEMLISRRLVGADLDAPALLGTALACARQRVVYKQPLVATRPPGAVGEVKGANYRYAIFSPQEAMAEAAKRSQAELDAKRVELGRAALAQYLASTNQQQQQQQSPTFTTDTDTDTTTTSTTYTTTSFTPLSTKKNDTPSSSVTPSQPEEATTKSGVNEGEKSAGKRKRRKRAPLEETIKSSSSK